MILPTATNLGRFPRHFRLGCSNLTVVFKQVDPIFHTHGLLLDRNQRARRSAKRNPATAIYANQRTGWTLRARCKNMRMSWKLDRQGWWHSNIANEANFNMLKLVASGSPNWRKMEKPFVDTYAHIWGSLIVEDMLNSGEWDPAKHPKEADKVAQGLLRSTYKRSQPHDTPSHSPSETLADDLSDSRVLPYRMARLRAHRLFSYYATDLAFWPTLSFLQGKVGPEHESDLKEQSAYIAALLMVESLGTLFSSVSNYLTHPSANYSNFQPSLGLASTMVSAVLSCVPYSGTEGRLMHSLLTFQSYAGYSTLKGIPISLLLPQNFRWSSDTAYKPASSWDFERFSILVIMLWNLIKHGNETDKKVAKETLTCPSLPSLPETQKLSAIQETSSAYKRWADKASVKWRNTLESVLCLPDNVSSIEDKELAAATLIEMICQQNELTKTTEHIKWPEEETFKTLTIIKGSSIIANTDLLSEKIAEAASLLPSRYQKVLVPCK